MLDGRLVVGAAPGEPDLDATTNAPRRVDAPNAVEQRVLSRTGAVAAILGTGLMVPSLFIHGDLPTHVSVSAALDYIVGHPFWNLVHFGMIAAGLLWIAAFVSLARTLAPGRAAAVGRYLAPSALGGGLFLVFDYLVDGFGFRAVAREWAAADAAGRADLERGVDTMIGLLNGTFRGELLLFYGLTFLLAGVGVLFDRGFPAWLGWVGAVAGALVIVTAMTSLLGLPFRIDALVFVGVIPLEGLWMIALGRLMWRRASVAAGAASDG